MKYANVENLSAILEEARAEHFAIGNRAKISGLAYPSSWGVETETALVLYALTRILRPEIVVETGVADGVSSELFLRAMARNGTGTLHSIDISPGVGSLITDQNNWSLHVISPTATRGDLGILARQIGPVDFFIHDGNHDYSHQTREYETFFEFL